MDRRECNYPQEKLSAPDRAFVAKALQVRVRLAVDNTGM